MRCVKDKSYIVASLLLISVNSVAANLSSTNASSEELFNLSLEDLLSISVSSATRTDKSILTAPSSITVFTRRQIQQMPVTKLHELLNFVPGFQSFRQGEAADEHYHSVRGRRVGTSSREVLILVNGVRYNRNSDGAIATPGVNLANIEKIEFIRGPGSALYGSNAFMGVINIETHTERREVKLNRNNTGLSSANITTSTQIKNWRAGVSAFIENDKGTEFYLEDKFSHAVSASKDPHNASDLKFSAHSATTEFEIVAQQREAFDYYVIDTLKNDVNNTKNQHFHLAVNQELTTDSSKTVFHADLQKNTYYARTIVAPEGFAAAYGVPAPGDSAPYIASTNQIDRSRTLSIHNDVFRNSNYSFQTGLEYRHIDQPEMPLNTNFNLATQPVSYTGNTLYETAIIAGKSKYEIYGLYQQHLWKTSNNIELAIGGRYDHYTEIKGAFSPRAGLTWQANARHCLKFLYGEAFRAPTTNELYFTSNYTLEGNPNLQPEEVKTKEFNWQYTGGAYYISTTFFENDVSNAIEQEFNGSVRTFANQNLGQTTNGIETEIMWNISPSWQLTANATSFFQSPDDQYRQADKLASFRIDYSAKQWHWNLSGHYNNERGMGKSDEIARLSPYTLLHTKFDFCIGQKQRIGLIVNNLTNKRYLTPPQGQVLLEGIPNRGREFSLFYQIAL